MRAANALAAGDRRYGGGTWLDQAEVSPDSKPSAKISAGSAPSSNDPAGGTAIPAQHEAGELGKIVRDPMLLAVSAVRAVRPGTNPESESRWCHSPRDRARGRATRCGDGDLRLRRVPASRCARLRSLLRDSESPDLASSRSSQVRSGQSAVPQHRTSTVRSQ